MSDAEDILRKAREDIFEKTNKIAEGFHRRFTRLRQKVHRLLNNEPLNDLDHHVYINSIFVDCRALFLENKRYTNNYTLQNFYRSRNFNKLAQEIDDFFDRPVAEGRPLREVIKEWVDKYVVHCDFTSDGDKNKAISDIEIVIDRTTLDNIFIDIMLIANRYEEFRAQFGKDMEEQVMLTLQWITEAPKPEGT